MKLGNVVLLCKGWYRMRHNTRLDLFWMDMAHAIDADGWTVKTKNDVATWCVHRLDNMRDDSKLSNYKNQFTFAYILDSINSWIRRASWSNIELSQQDAIIWVFRDIVQGLSKDCFNEELKPNPNVLPVDLQESWLDDGKYNKQPKFHFAQMMCEYMDMVNETMPNAKEQDIDKDDYNWVESFLNKESWKDVQIELGEDNLNDCIEVECKASDLKKRNIQSLGEYYIELGKFENCKDLGECKDPDKKLIVRLYKKVTHYNTPGWEDDVTYYLKSIREE